MQASTPPLRSYLLVVLSTLLWSSNIALGRLLREQISPITLTAARFLIAGLLYAWLLRGRQAQSLARKDWLLLGGMAAAGVAGFPTLLYFSLRFTTASHAALINAAAPLLTSFLAAVILRERITPALLLGSSISLLGVGLVIGGNLETQLSTQVLIGDFLAFITAGLWGLYSVLARIATRNRPSLDATAYSTWLALPLLLAAAGIDLRASATEFTPITILAMVYIGIFPSVIAFLAWNEGVRRLGPNQAMAFYNLLPVFSVILGVAFLGERLTWLALLGGMLVVAGGLATALFKERSKK